MKRCFRVEQQGLQLTSDQVKLLQVASEKINQSPCFYRFRPFLSFLNRQLPLNRPKPLFFWLEVERRDSEQIFTGVVKNI